MIRIVFYVFDLGYADCCCNSRKIGGHRGLGSVHGHFHLVVSLHDEVKHRTHIGTKINNNI